MLLKTVPEQRAPFYEDIEALIAPGFLTKQVSIRNVSFAIRSLYPRDLFLLRNSGGAGDWRAWTVAASIWMIDGIPLFKASADSVSVLAKWAASLPPGYLERLFAVTRTLFSRTREALSDVQPYLYESRSRQLWNSTGKGSAFDDRFFGIPGVQDLGRNHVQKIWTMWNQAEDQSSTDRFQWQMTKTVVSAHAPKGVKRMNATDATRERGEKERRERVLDLFYYKKMGIVGEDAVLYDAQGNPITRLGGASTPAELSDEFFRWVRGEEDPHDKVVNSIKAGIIRAMQEREEERQKALEARQEGLTEQDGPYAYIPEDQVTSLSGPDSRDGRRRVYDQQVPGKSKAWIREVQPPPTVEQAKSIYSSSSDSPKTRPDINQMIQSRLPKVD